MPSSAEKRGGHGRQRSSLPVRSGCDCPHRPPTAVATLAAMASGEQQRIDGVDPERVEPRIHAALDAQAKQWGAPLKTSLVYARVPAVFRAQRAMGSGLAEAGLIDAKLHALLNLRVASLNGCVF